MWFWYSIALRNGQRLYRDMHVPMQPLFILLTKWNQQIFGESWLASKILAAIQVLLYVSGLYVITDRIPWADWKKALVILCVFGMTIMAFYSRFDDFHITGQCLLVASLILLLPRDLEHREATWRAALLGLFAGLAIGNRLNDGGMLFIASGTALLVLSDRRRIFRGLVFCSTAALALGMLVALTRSSLHDWSTQTIFRATAIKGGSSQIFSAPFHFPVSISFSLLGDPHLVNDLALASLLFVGITYSYVLKAHNNRYRRVFASLTVAYAIGSVLFLLQQSLSGSSVLSVSDACTVGTYVLFVTLSLRLLHRALFARTGEWNRYEVFLLFPFGQMVSGAMTSGESFLEAYPPLAFLLLLITFILPDILSNGWKEKLYTSLLLFLAVGSFISKTSHPYYWHHYNDRGFFLARQWYQHPQLGPMYIETAQLDFMQSLCSQIEPSQHTELLAMPWPYPNYFCNVAPWHGYVQTWYDTSSKATIDHLREELQEHPPEWIAYQRSFDMIGAHEITFNNNKRLPHRDMDDDIEAKLRSNQWTLTWQRCFGGADWLLIHTRPVRSGEPSDVLLPSNDYVNLCSRTGYW